MMDHTDRSTVKSQPPPIPPRQVRKAEDFTYTHLIRGQHNGGTDVVEGKAPVSIKDFLDCINGGCEKCFKSFVVDYCNIFDKSKSSVMCKCQMQKIGQLFMRQPKCIHVQNSCSSV